MYGNALHAYSYPLSSGELGFMVCRKKHQTANKDQILGAKIATSKHIKVKDCRSWAVGTSAIDFPCKRNVNCTRTNYEVNLWRNTAGRHAVHYAVTRRASHGLHRRISISTWGPHFVFAGLYWTMRFARSDLSSTCQDHVGP
ncbi:hypothetical protein Nepgr_006187 [Nepenthes gracilis]|uniref:Uncharacterized protein n=1 Tax=Nepenthes gracilis TaxID=150966 RepID=A0AAD3XH58_NEPGR|nr:hypothetical protein Nepgr_006187 [Nepenthes gracilis]